MHANVAATTGEWRLHFLFRGVLYKVKGDDDAAGNPYLLDTLAEEQVNDITIDLRVLHTVARFLMSKADDEEEEEEEGKVTQTAHSMNMFLQVSTVSFSF